MGQTAWQTRIRCAGALAAPRGTRSPSSHRQVTQNNYSQPATLGPNPMLWDRIFAYCFRQFFRIVCRFTQRLRRSVELHVSAFPPRHDRPSGLLCKEMPVRVDALISLPCLRSEQRGRAAECPGDAYFVRCLSSRVPYERGTPSLSRLGRGNGPVAFLRLKCRRSVVFLPGFEKVSAGKRLWAAAWEVSGLNLEHRIGMFIPDSSFCSSGGSPPERARGMRCPVALRALKLCRLHLGL